MLGIAASADAANKFWNTNGASSTWTASNWGTSSGGPFTNGWASLDIANFTANSAITYVSLTNVGGINITNSSLVTLTPAGTFTTGGTVVTFNIGAGSTLDFAGQGMSTAAGTGFIKTGAGTYFTANGNNYTGGFTLNDGIIVLGGTVAMGNGGQLTINGGTLAANNNRVMTGRYTSFTIGGDFTMGAVTTTLPVAENATSAANISIDTNASLGAATRTITIGSNGTYSLLGILSGSVGTGLNVAASSGATGNLTLSGASTFDGGTTVNSGILSVGAGSTVTGGVVASGPIGKGTLTLNGGTFRSTAPTTGGDRTFQNNLALNGTITMGDATNTGVLTFNSTGLTTPATITLVGDTALTTASGVVLNNVIGGSGRSLTKAGTASLTLGAANTFSGTYTASNGTTNLSVNNALGGVTAVSVSSGATLQTSVILLSNAINDAAAVTDNGTIDITGGTETVGSLAGTNAAASLAIGLNGTTEGSFTVGDSTSTSFAGIISGSRLAADAGTAIFTKQGTGILTLGGTNTYTDVTAITAGGITLTNSAGLGATGANNGTTVSSGAVLALDGTAGNLTVGNELLTLNGAGLTGSPNGALRNIAGNNSYAGAITLGSASTITSSAGTLTLSGGITNAGFLTTFDGAGNTTVSSAITGAGGVTKNGNGTLQFSGASANTYTGVTTVSAGELDLNKTAGVNAITGDGNRATNDVTVSGGTLKWLANEQVDDTSTITVAGGTVDLNGKTETLGSLIVNSGTFQTGAGHLIGTTATVQFAGGTSTINSGGIVEDGHIVVTGGTNTVQGGATEGLLHLLSGGLGLQMTGANITLNSDATAPGRLLLDGNVSTTASSTTSSITSAGSAANAGSVDLGTGTRTFTVASGSTSSGIDLSIGAKIIAPGGALTKAGPGTMELTGANTYAGGTNVNGGTLLANNTAGSATGSAGVMVNSGGLLGGTGAIVATGNNININGNGAITGATSGTVGALTLTATSVIFGGTAGNLSTYLVDLSPSTSDRLSITGNLDLSSLFDQITFQGTTGAASYQLITYSGILSGTFDTISSLPTGYSLSYSTPGEIDLVAVPEASTWLIGALALGSLFLFRRVRRAPQS